MAKIEKNFEIITQKTVFEFRKTLEGEQKSSIFSAFLDADMYKEDGSAGMDFKLQGDEISKFYTMIGDTLKQKFESWYSNNLKTEKLLNNIMPFNSSIESNVYNSKKYKNTIKDINVDNIETVLLKTTNTSYGEYFIRQIANPVFKDENGDYTDVRSLNDIEKDCNHIRKVLQKLCEKYGIDTSEIDKEEFEIIKEGTLPDGTVKELESPIFDANDILSRYVKLIDDHKKSQELKSKLNIDYRPEMQAAINERYEELVQRNVELTTDNPVKSETQETLERYAEEFQSLLEDSENLYADKPEKIEYFKQEIAFIKSHLHDDGNGKFDKPAAQKTGNCWLLSGINALVATDFGKEFLERNILKDEEKNLFAVHLKEAENKKLPRPKGDGIFVFTEKEVLDAQHGENGLASGDGDVAALALAVEKYLEIANDGNLDESKENFSDGNSVFKFFEIITGEKKDTFSKRSIGINHLITRNVSGNEMRLQEFENVFELAKEKKSAIIIANDNHGFSVVGTEDDCILVQESNQGGNYKNVFELIPNSFPPTYKIPKDVFEKNITSCSILRWE